MCGIVGYWPINPSLETGIKFAHLFNESQVRGLHAFGLARPQHSGGKFDVVRSFNPDEIIVAFNPDYPTIAHARYSQSGDWQNMANNQPIVAAGMALAHNGVIHMGTKEEFEAAFDVKCEADNDSEIFLRKLEKGVEPLQFINDIEGSFAGVWLEGFQIRAGRNARRPLWRCYAYGALWWASTRDIFRRAGFPLVAEEVLPGSIEWPSGGANGEVIKMELV